MLLLNADQVKFLRKMAGRKMARLDLLKLGFFAGANLFGILTTGMELAPGRRIDWTGHVAAQNNATTISHFYPIHPTSSQW